MVRQKSKSAAKIEARVNEAVLGVLSGLYKSSYEAAKQLRVSKDTVTRRVNGGLSRSQARQQQQKLSYEQENVLLKWIKQLTISGYSPGHQLLKEIAEELRTKRTYNLDNASLNSLELPPQYTLGRDWVPRFILRHPHLTVAIGRRIESVRMDGATKEVLNAWFNAYKKVVEECKITQENTYNMDESGFSIGTMESTRIIFDSTLRTKHQAHPGRQEWVSMVECICADGTILPPLGIFKGKNVLQNWIPNEVLEQWFFSANTKGWTSNLHGLEWLKRVFEPSTRTKANGQYRLLICDGHDSHISGSFIAHCLQNRIVLLILPPHTSHLLQPLDVAIFGPLKKRLTAALSNLNQAQLVRIQKIEWMEAYIQARLDVCNHQNIESAWRGAGLFPFNPQRALRTMVQEEPYELERPKTPTQFDIFDRVFVNSSPPNETTLRAANELLNSTIQARTDITTPVRQYIKKLTAGTEKLQAQSIVHQHDANNLRSIIKKRTTRTKGKRVVLKGHFHISTQELCNAVVEAEKATKKPVGKKGKTKGKGVSYETESEADVEEEGQDESESDIGDCIIVDVRKTRFQ
jgi:transposase